MAIKITAIDYFLPKDVVTNNDLKKDNPDWNLDGVEKKSGVLERHIASEDETALDLAVYACTKLFNQNPTHKQDIDAVIFCTQSPDYIMPPNSYLLQNKLRLSENIMAYDFNLACSGYIYSVAMSHSLIFSGLAKKVLLVNADTYSKYISHKDRSTRVLFGDAAAVTIAEKSNEKGIIDTAFLTDGASYKSFYIPAGGSRMPKSKGTGIFEEDNNGNLRSKNNIYMDGLSVWAAINSRVPKQIKSLLQKNHLSISDVDHYFFHQASKMTIDSLIKALGIDSKKVFINLTDKGNTVSASIPIAMKEAIQKKILKRGDLLLLSGFGVGMSYAAMLIKY
jgi:3-oxoacyl-[acyl-carrier-protein] synthase III